ncbi:MAG: NAD(P)/FAD-dependent oxidoreductase [Candidatus Aenigmarchaeota archaeon]|nr:NAD(P)/FAD-dependent oxidoreductase [Candidatus Aenigmarchaeota archaeon]MBU5689365.1 NAD(P)/FAD-dependent oxidoreductase [Candidatus Aenigmarchaeota archaeon]
MLKNIYDVIVIGAGPAGGKTAELAASLGLNVLVIEEHEEIGLPVQCTGIDSHRIIQLSGLKESDIVINKVNRARFYSQNGNFLELESKKTVYVIDRHKLDKNIAINAVKKGAEILTGTRFKDFKRSGNYLMVHTSSGNFKTKLLVGADGPNSSVARKAKIEQPKEYLIGYQETIKDDFSENIVELWFGKDITPDFFAWVVPENKNWARVGLAAKNKAVDYFRNFIKKRFKQEYDKKDVLGGVIRYGLIKSSVADNILLVGDAASHVKPYSGGGIIYGLIAAKFAAESCFLAVEKNRFDKEFLNKEYDQKWKKVLSPAIKRGLFLHDLIHIMPNWLFSLSLNIAKPFRPLLNNLDMDLLFNQ